MNEDGFFIAKAWAHHLPVAKLNARSNAGHNNIYSKKLDLQILTLIENRKDINLEPVINAPVGNVLNN